MHRGRAELSKSITSLLVVGVALLAILLVGCSDEPSPTPLYTPIPSPTSTTAPTVTPAPTPTATPTPTPEPTATPLEPGPDPPDVSIDADTPWQEVFDTLTASEQSCIRSALKNDLESVLDQPVLTEEDAGEWEESISSCLDPENARAILLSAWIASAEEEVDRDLSEAEASCMQELVASTDLAALVAASEDFDAQFFACLEVPENEFDLYPDSLWQEAFDASEQMCIRNELGDDLLKSALNRPILRERETGQWEVSILECLEPATATSLVYSLMLAGMEAEGLALDEEAKYCIWGLLADTDVAEIMAASLPDAGPGSEAMVEEFDSRLFACLEGQLNMGAGEPAAGPPPPDESLIWQYDTGNPGELLIVSPTVADGVLYAGSYEDRVYALDADTGELLWSFETESDLSPPPLVAGGVVFVEDLANR